MAEQSSARWSLPSARVILRNQLTLIIIKIEKVVIKGWCRFSAAAFTFAAHWALYPGRELPTSLQMPAFFVRVPK